jgi:hypothetical protein
MPPARISPSKRFWTKVDKTGNCWLWTAGQWGSNPAFRYGKFFDGTKHVAAHRFSLTEKLGRPLRNGMKALHHCDNCLCVRPAHLFEGTQGDNIRDMTTKGRGKGKWTSAKTSGDQNCKAKLTVLDVKTIRDLAGFSRQKDIGRRFGITQSQVSKIVLGRVWT